MENLAPEPSEKSDEKRIRIDAHLEPLEGKMLAETLDILASIICDYLDKDGKNEREESD